MFNFSSPNKRDDDLVIPDIDVIDGGGHLNSEIWGFTSASGGAGVTSLCIQIAYALSNRPEVRNRVCLIDLDFESGLVASYLNQTPVADLSDLRPDASDIDDTLAKSLMTTFSETLDLLVFPQVLNGNAKVDPDKVIDVLDYVSTQYDYIILDIPRLWAPWTHAALGAADRLFMVTELTIPNLQATKTRWDAIRQVEGLEHLSPDILINKHERRSFRNSLNIGDAEKGLGVSVFGSICTQVDALREAINRGEPAGQASPDSRYVKDVADLLEKIETQAKAQPALRMAS